LSKRSKSKEIEILALDNQGRGVAQTEGSQITLPFTIPGEKLSLPRFHPNQLQDYEFLSQSPDRVEPPCPVFGKCGGCQLQHLSYERQLKEKSHWLKENLVPWVPEERIIPIIPSPKIWNYRRRIQLHVGRGGELGFYGIGSHQVVPIKECPIAELEINQAIPKLQKRAREAITEKKRPTLMDFEMTVKSEGGVEITTREQRGSFLQVNKQANEQLHVFLKDAFSKIRPKNVLELYSGNGNLTFPLVGETLSWTGVESNSFALKEAQETQRGRFPQIHWVQGSSEKILQKKAQSREDFELVLLDPPRDGAKACIKPLIKLKPHWILYVSCYPPSLKRDLRGLLKGPYQVEWVQGMDFFPQTMHLETVVLFRRSHL